MPRFWTFHAGDHEVELDLRPDPQQSENRWQLAAKLLGSQTAGHLMLAPADGQGEAKQQMLDDSGAFQLDGLPAGRWLPSLALSDRRIALPPLRWADGEGG